MKNLTRLIRLIRPVNLIVSILVYTFGASIARYLGSEIRWNVFWIGFMAILSLQSVPVLLSEYFRLPEKTPLIYETILERERFRTLILQISVTLLGIYGLAIIFLFFAHALSLPVGILLTINLIICVVYGLSPIRLGDSGYGEVTLAIEIGMFLPAIAFLLQTNEMHRLLPVTTFPVTLLIAAYFMLEDFSTYSIDQKFNRRTILVVLSWQKAIPVHHVLVGSAFVLFAISPIVGLPLGLVWPVFLALPFVVVQVGWLQWIGRGGRALWNILIPLAGVGLCLVVYLLTLPMWLR